MILPHASFWVLEPSNWAFEDTSLAHQLTANELQMLFGYCGVLRILPSINYMAFDDIIMAIINYMCFSWPDGCRYLFHTSRFSSAFTQNDEKLIFLRLQCWTCMLIFYLFISFIYLIDLSTPHAYTFYKTFKHSVLSFKHWMLVIMSLPI